MCQALAVAGPELGASVPFQGRQVPGAVVPRIEVPLKGAGTACEGQIRPGFRNDRRRAMTGRRLDRFARYPA